jgi:hypothetical protein
LRRDAGVIHARQPQRTKAAHSVPPRERVDLRMLQHVPDVDRTGNVRRRNDDAEAPALRIGRAQFGAYLGCVQSLLHPSFRPAQFDLLRIVRLGKLCCFRRILRHWPARHPTDKPTTIRAARKSVKSTQLTWSLGLMGVLIGRAFSSRNEVRDVLLAVKLLLFEFALHQGFDYGTQKFARHQVDNLGLHAIDYALHDGFHFCWIHARGDVCRNETREL